MNRPVPESASPSRLVLQRLRFCGLKPFFDPPDTMFRKFDPADWTGKCQSTYWRSGSDAHPGAFQEGHAENGVRCAPGERLSGDTFFNAFFAAQWRRLTRIGSIGLRLRLGGRFRVEVLRHDELGGSAPIASGEWGAGEWDVPLDLPAEGSWGLRLSLALTALEEGAEILGGGWYTEDAPAAPVRLAIAITTHNRKAFVVPLCERLLADPALREEGVRIEVVDQSDADELGGLNGERCRVTRQRNLGGAGGFARALRTILEEDAATGPTHVLVMDDDVMAETDSVLRAIRMMQFARAPFVLGGVMLDAHRPVIARNLGQTFRRNDEKFHSASEHLHQFDVGDAQALDAYSVPYPSDYSAWWFCMVPAEALRKAGLPAPFFYQGDDVEHGVRMGRCGYPSRVVPGIGVWHMPFHSKAASWSHYFRYYNTMVVNALQGAEVCAAAFRHTGIKALFFLYSSNYRDAVAVVRAMEDIAAGWGRFRERRFPEYLAEIRAEIGRYPADAVLDPRILHALQARLHAASTAFQGKVVDFQREAEADFPGTYAAGHWDRLFAGQE